MSIKRYDEYDSGICHITEMKNGGFVQYEDHKAAIKELVEVLEEYEKKSIIQRGDVEVVTVRQRVIALIDKYNEQTK